jgi:hypothetical protein
MRRESHRRRGLSRASSGGLGHRAIYFGAGVATAALVVGFALAGFYFGTFAHVFNSSSASGNSGSPYGVLYLGEYATYAGLVPGLNFTNLTNGTGPCVNVTANGTDQLNNSSLGPGASINLTSPNINDTIVNTTSDTNFTNFVCMNAVDQGNITYLWQYVNGTFVSSGTNASDYFSDANYTAWDNVSAEANNTSGTNGVNGNGTFNESLANLTGNANLSGEWLNETGCSPVFSVTNATDFANASRCAFFEMNNNTTYLPHAGFWGYNSTCPGGCWITEANNTSLDPAYWEPNQTGYLPSDQVYQATIGFIGNLTNQTYEVVVSMQYVTPIPQVVFVNSGTGQNATLTFLFDMTLAWTTALGNSSYGLNDSNPNGTNGYFSAVVASVGTVSITVYQCYVDASGNATCPDTTGGATTLPFGPAVSFAPAEPSATMSLGVAAAVEPQLALRTV